MTAISPAPNLTYRQLVPLLRFMFANHSPMISEAVDLYMTRYHGAPTLARLPGADTATRMANRLGCGLSVDAAALLRL